MSGVVGCAIDAAVCNLTKAISRRLEFEILSQLHAYPTHTSMSSTETQNSPSQDIKTASSSNSNNKKSELPTRNSNSKVKPGGTSVAPEGGKDQLQQDGVASTDNDSNSKDEVSSLSKLRERFGEGSPPESGIAG